MTLLLCISCIQGFDEYMNIVLDDAAEVNTKSNASVPIGMEGNVMISCSM